MAEEKEESTEDFLARSKRCVWHKHSRSDLAVFGELLKPGDTIAADDMYDSSNGKWESAPCPGLVLQKGTAAIWVRPLHKNPRQELYSYVS